jgi:hypothetical protein
MYPKANAQLTLTLTLTTTARTRAWWIRERAWIRPAWIRRALGTRRVRTRWFLVRPAMDDHVPLPRGVRCVHLALSSFETPQESPPPQHIWLGNERRKRACPALSSRTTLSPPTLVHNRRDGGPRLLRLLELRVHIHYARSRRTPGVLGGNLFHPGVRFVVCFFDRRGAYHLPASQRVAQIRPYCDGGSGGELEPRPRQLHGGRGRRSAHGSGVLWNEQRLIRIGGNGETFIASEAPLVAMWN